MSRRRMVICRRSSAVAVLLLMPVLVLADAAKEASQIRVKLALDVNGSFQHTGARPEVTGFRIKAFVDDSYRVEYVIPAETILTGPQKTNPMDPASQQAMDEYHAKVKARDDRIYHSADNLRKPSTGPGANPMAMMNPDMMQKIMACGNDQSCKQRVATEMMSQQLPSASPNAQVQADIQVISNMCINERHQKMGTKGYEDCMNEEGRKRGAVPASAADDEPEVPELPDRYLLYRNYGADCKFKGHTKINESTTSIYADVQGWVETTQSVTGDGDADPKAFPPCTNEQAVFDPVTNTFWLNGLQPAVVPTTSMGQTTTPNSINLPPEIGKWISETLRGAPSSGSQTKKFGYQTAKFTWSIVRE